MENNWNKQIEAIILKGLSGQHTSWQFIKNNTEAKVVKELVTGLRKIVSILKTQADKAHKNFCTNLETSSEMDFTSDLAVYEIYLRCLNFYNKELDLAIDELHEYKSFINSGNRIRMMLGGERTEEECVDNRVKEGEYVVG